MTYVVIKQNSVEDMWIKKVKGLLSRIWWSGTPDRFDVVYSDNTYKVLRFKG